MTLCLPDGRTYFIEFTVCADALVVKRYQEKVEKYQPLCRASIPIFNSAPRLLVFAVGCTGAIGNGTLTDLGMLKKLGVALSPATLQRTAAVGSLKVVEKVLYSYE
jgi:hypothetical protein